MSRTNVFTRIVNAKTARGDYGEIKAKTGMKYLELSSKEFLDGDDLITVGTAGGQWEGNTVFSHDGNDFINGFSSNLNDYFHGGKGSDFINGGFGDDLIRGGKGPDFLIGNSGSDTLWGDFGRNYLDGGVGGESKYSDSFVVTVDSKKNEFGNPGGIRADVLLNVDKNDKIFINGAADSTLSFREDIIHPVTFWKVIAPQVSYGYDAGSKTGIGIFADGILEAIVVTNYNTIQSAVEANDITVGGFF